jgi:hypothetical protein
VQSLHHLSQIQGVKLEPNPGKAVFRNDVDVIRVDRVGRDLDPICVALLDIDRLGADPLVPDDAPVENGDRAGVVRLEPLEKHSRDRLARCESVQILDGRASNFHPPPEEITMLGRHAAVLEKIQTVNLQRFERDPLQQAPEIDE